ncbi:hypothetical protein H4Q26_013816 [Puccinia striiformis f. sp. tritici PST-130]|nr:hypothetical protein H4Q26_013816 [Puccinia striiformis f. sp. tritici PST-130]
MNFTFLMMFIYLENLKTLSEGSLITSADHRLDWSTIQNIEASFVPHLKLVTNTSYFPTDDLGDVPNEPVGADTDSGSKDLAFLGYTISKLLRLFSINE